MKCVKCGGNKIEEIGKMRHFFVSLGTGSALLFIGIIIWPLLFIAIPTLLAAPLALTLPKVYKCHECKKVFGPKQLKKV